MKLRTAAIAGLAVVLLGTALAAGTGAQLSSYEDLNDEPIRRGEPWYRGGQGDGHGENDFYYTYVQGTDNASNERIDTRASAYWNFRNVPQSTCRIDVYVPSDRATAGVQYHIYEGDNYKTAAYLRQSLSDGWTELTTLDLQGSVRIWLLNYSARGFAPTADSRGHLYNRIAADAIRLRCTVGHQTIADTSISGEPGPDTQFVRHVQSDDSPTKDGRPWYRGSDGYQNEAFSYSYVRATTNSRDETINSHARSRWDFQNVPSGSTCQVEAFIPGSRATADVHYHIFENGSHADSFALDQANQGDWVALGTLELQGTIRIYLINWTWRSLAPKQDQRGYQYNRIAADAMRLVCDYHSGAIVAIAAILPQYPYSAGGHDGGYECGRFDANDADDWGFFKGECTSYVAFRINAADRDIEFTSGYGDQQWGHAACWSSAAQNAGVPVSDDPARGAVAEWRHQWRSTDFISGAECNDAVTRDNLTAEKEGRPLEWGHVAYVESVNSDGSIVISDMNFGDSACTLREKYIVRPGDPSWPDNFIHFEEAG